MKRFCDRDQNREQNAKSVNEDILGDIHDLDMGWDSDLLSSEANAKEFFVRYIQGEAFLTTVARQAHGMSRRFRRLPPEIETEDRMPAGKVTLQLDLSVTNR